MDDQTNLSYHSKFFTLIKMTSKNVKANLKRFKYVEPIKITEPYNPEVIKFDSTEEFTTYYREHEDEFKDVPTIRLNRKYKIPGYRIKRSKVKTSNENGEEITTSEIELIKDYYKGIKSKDSIDPELESRMKTVERQLKEVFAELANIQKYLTEI